MSAGLTSSSFVGEDRCEVLCVHVLCVLLAMDASGLTAGVRH